MVGVARAAGRGTNFRMLGFECGIRALGFSDLRFAASSSLLAGSPAADLTPPSGEVNIVVLANAGDRDSGADSR